MTRVLAHRGDASAAKENTIPAFLAAAEAGAHGVELDVRRTSDGALVIHHDAAAEGRPIAATRLRELPDDLPLLDEALRALEGLLVNVEIKNDPREPGYDAGGSLGHAVVAQLAELGALDTVVVSCFDLPTLDAVRQASATVETGWLLATSARPREAIEPAVAHGIGALHPFVLTLGDDDVDAAHEAGLDVATWTVNARHDLVRVVTSGVDTVITDDVVLALEVVAENGVPGPASA